MIVHSLFSYLADAGAFTFVIVGNVSPDSLEPLVRRYLASLPATGRNERWRDIGVRPPSGVVEREVHRGTEPKAFTEIIFTGPFEWTRENRYALSSLAEVMRIAGSAAGRGSAGAPG